MDILILGGTHFVGRHIALALLAAGHRVTTFTRGISPDELPAGVERLRGDRDCGPAALDCLEPRRWDACIDVSGYTPRQVRPSAEVLRERVARYIFISAVATYGDPVERPVRESHPQVEPAPEDEIRVVGELYARLKVACERIVESLYGPRATILRPQIVVGPYDESGRYSYWLNRAEQAANGNGAAPMLAPGDGRDHVQFIDVRDVARFARVAVEADLDGPFNLAGPRMTWREFIRVIGAEPAATLVWTPAAVIRAAGVDEFALPLFREERGPRAGLMDISNERATAAGLTLMPPADTARDTRAWLSGRPWTPLLSAEREAELIAIARRHRDGA